MKKIKRTRRIVAMLLSIAMLFSVAPSVKAGNDNSQPVVHHSRSTKDEVFIAPNGLPYNVKLTISWDTQLLSNNKVKVTNIQYSYRMKSEYSDFSQLGTIDNPNFNGKTPKWKVVSDTSTTKPRLYVYYKCKSTNALYFTKKEASGAAVLYGYVAPAPKGTMRYLYLRDSLL